jgi:16S rRNA (cytidine1402-2'-O)-methyltransferase
MLALMASGLPGQRFAFHGYLPTGRSERGQKLREIEIESGRRRETQIFIETPYRNLALLGALTSCCRANTLLCIATDLTGAAEQVSTRPIADWKHGSPPSLAKLPTVFLLYAADLTEAP